MVHLSRSVNQKNKAELFIILYLCVLFSVVHVGHVGSCRLFYIVYPENTSNKSLQSLHIESIIHDEVVLRG